MRRVILESPYAGEVKLNAAYAQLCMRDSLLRGEAPIASHLMYPSPFGFEDSRTIELTRGFSVVVDVADLERVSTFKWLAMGAKPNVYAARNVRENGRRRTIYMHRFLLDASSDEEVDHANGDRLDNRRANLRLCSHAENSKNTKRRSDSSSGFKGVRKIGGRWIAYIKHSGVQRTIGRFATAVEAARAYDAFAISSFGRFARTNFTAHAALDDSDPEERALGIEAGLAWGVEAEATVVYTDLGISRGMRYGIERAEKEGRPVEYRLIAKPLPHISCGYVEGDK